MLEVNGTVYVVHAVGTHFIKIGVTNNMTHRLKTLQTASPYKLEIVCCFQNPVGIGNLETMLHTAFAKYRHRGEWFEVPFASDYEALLTEIANTFQQLFNHKRLRQTQDYRDKYPDSIVNLQVVHAKVPQIDVSLANKILAYANESIDGCITTGDVVKQWNTELSHHVVRKALNFLVRRGDCLRIKKYTYQVTRQGRHASKEQSA